MIVAKNQGNCSPVYTYTNQSLLSITFHGLYPRTCQVLKFTPCVCFWCRLSNMEWYIVDVHLLKNRPPMRLAVEMQQLGTAKCFQWRWRESGEKAYIFRISSSYIVFCHYLFPDSWKDLHFQFFYVGSAPIHSFLFSAHTILFSCLCFLVCVFFSS